MSLYTTIYMCSQHGIYLPLLQMSGEVPTLYVGHAGAYASSVLLI